MPLGKKSNLLSIKPNIPFPTDPITVPYITDPAITLLKVNAADVKPPSVAAKAPPIIIALVTVTTFTVAFSGMFIFMPVSPLKNPIAAAPGTVPPKAIIPPIVIDVDINPTPAPKIMSSCICFNS